MTPKLVPTKKITPAPYSILANSTPAAVLGAAFSTETHYEFKVSDLASSISTMSPAATVEELIMNGDTCVEVWFRGVRLGVVDLTAREKLGL